MGAARGTVQARRKHGTGTAQARHWPAFRISRPWACLIGCPDDFEAPPGEGSYECIVCYESCRGTWPGLYSDGLCSYGLYKLSYGLYDFEAPHGKGDYVCIICWESCRGAASHLVMAHTAIAHVVMACVVMAHVTIHCLLGVRSTCL